jgi:hypothetical protein
MTHYRNHGHEFPGYTIEQYDQSAHETVEIGILFEYADPDSDDDRTGYFDLATGRFTGTTLDGLIVTHFVTTEGYVIGLPYNDYPLDLG